MKNKMLKGAHLSEITCREIIELFSEGLTATHISNVTKVSRVTINNYVKWIRMHIANYCSTYNKHNQISQLEKVTTNRSLKDLNARSSYYGFYTIDEKIFTQELDTISNVQVRELKQADFSHRLKDFGLKGLSKYQAIADFDEWNLYRLGNTQLNDEESTDHISIFWSSTRSRLQKFRGLSKSTLYLHVKESEFRYNYRNDNINRIVVSLIYSSDKNFMLTKK